jgi:3' terminal RNA ribose 2'-O-methyltransferase Hen1
LRHLYVLIPVLDDDKHYWVGKDEVDKLLTKGADWLPGHPLKEEIAKRYLLNQRHLTRDALARLSEMDGDPDPDAREAEAELAMEQKERKLSLHDQRIDAVADVIMELGARRVLDLGCGEGKLLRRLLKLKEISELVGMDVSLRSLERARRFIRMEQMSDRQIERIKLVHGSLTYRDRALEGYDAAALVEVIEHLDLARLQALQRTVFEFAQPRAIVVTTPNREYNELFEGMEPGALRHPDHRFEWTRQEFRDWAEGVAKANGYNVELRPLGEENPDKGAPSQMAVFRR